MQGILERLNTQLPEVSWPRFLPPFGTSLLALLYQLEKSPFLPDEWQRQQQLKQANLLLQHAFTTVPYYRDKFSQSVMKAELSYEDWLQIPISVRKDIQQAGEALVSERLPPTHGQLRIVTTSGSTGMPITCYGTELTHHVWLASSLMEHFWHLRDVASKHVSIRPAEHVTPGQVKRGNSWAPPVQTGPSVVLNSRSDVQFQVQVLQQENPAYLLSLPSNLKALAELCREEAISLPELKGVRSYGEVLSPETRQYCEETWGVGVTDVYSAQEIGNMAFQCPEQGKLHVFGDGVLLEVLRDDGTPCLPGEVGQVVVTTLLNYGCPLIRYALGDYAELGGCCSCGRNTPVLKRVHGRQRNMLHIPGGGKIWPIFSVKEWAKDLPISQFQFVQSQFDEIHARLVTKRTLTIPEEKRLIRTLQESLGYPFHIVISYHQGIPRSKSGKFEDFISELGS